MLLEPSLHGLGELVVFGSPSSSLRRAPAGDVSFSASGTSNDGLIGWPLLVEEELGEVAGLGPLRAAGRR